MLFNSFEFILLFVPLTLLGYYMSSRYISSTLSKVVLIGASLFFYSYWNIRYLPLLIFSIIFNYIMGRILIHYPKRYLLFLGVSTNLILLGYFKYINFFIDNINSFFSTDFNFVNIVLPLAISFFTFQQISFLVDSYRKETQEYDFLNYILFVSFFPQLIAGPIVHHKEIIPQFYKSDTYRLNYSNLSKGMLVFFIGLFKKVVIADTLSAWVSPAFDVAVSVTTLESWAAAISYTLQLYFDFSGYSDMAIGLGLLFNINIPKNFDSPYKANSIIDFWRRWHMTLSRFLRDYVYIPLGGNRKGEVRRYINLFITMLLGGLWHGAGWTFVIWGGLHGLYLIINHIYRKFSNNMGMNLFISRVITFICVTVGWVFFRANTFSDAFKILKEMFLLDGLKFYATYYLPQGIVGLLILVLLYIVVNTMPNSLAISKRFKPTGAWLIFITFLSTICILNLNKISEFLYFQF